MSDDEFDIVDDIANLEGVDWDTILAVQTHELAARRPPSADSSHYSFDDLDQHVFAQVDTLERNTPVLPSSITGKVETDRYTP
jgi:hypothetical protein